MIAAAWVLTLTLTTAERVEISVSAETCAHYNTAPIEQIDWSISIDGKRVPVESVACVRVGEFVSVLPPLHVGNTGLVIRRKGGAHE